MNEIAHNTTQAAIEKVILNYESESAAIIYASLKIDEMEEGEIE